MLGHPKTTEKRDGEQGDAGTTESKLQFFLTLPGEAKRAVKPAFNGRSRFFVSGIWR